MIFVTHEQYFEDLGDLYIQALIKFGLKMSHHKCQVFEAT